MSRLLQQAEEVRLLWNIADPGGRFGPPLVGQALDGPLDDEVRLAVGRRGGPVDQVAQVGRQIQHIELGRASEEGNRLGAGIHVAGLQQDRPDLEHGGTGILQVDAAETHPG
jgi:hypothetical protein